MAVVAFIPVRLGSTRYPGKPLAMIAGKPMVQRVFEQAVKAEGVDRVVVATEDGEIASAVEGFGGEAVLTGAGHPCGTDRIAEAARKLNLAKDDIAVNIQGDQPLCPPGLVSETIAPLLADPELGMATPVTPMNHRAATDPSNVCVTVDENGFALYFSRAIIPSPRDPGTRVSFLKHLGVYAYRVWFLEAFNKLPQGKLEQIEKLEQLRALEYGFRIKIVFTEYDSIEVDRPDDIPRVEALLAKRGDG